jgi:hypothetical protein
LIRWKKYGKTLNGYEGLYQISNLGRVKSLGNLQNRKEKLLKTNIRNGYYTTYLYKNNKKKSFLCHRLVAEAFIPNPKNLPQVNHKDENKLNNCVNNLEWCTNGYNINYSCAKSVICVETGAIYHSLTEVSKKHNIQLALLSRVCDKDNYRAGGFHWKSL